jgi:spore coat polysaccharide biosynthesis protein SpsF
MHPKIVGIIQARMDSSRLPGKTMTDLCGYPVIQWVIERCKRSLKLDEIVVATTIQSVDDVLDQFARRMQVHVYRGNQHDVLGRFIEAAKLYDAEVIVRICADNPLVAPEEIDRLIDYFLEVRPDYAFNHIPKMGNNYPNGLGAEILTYQLLKYISSIARLATHREHVTQYVTDNMDTFDVRTFPCSAPYNEPKMKLDIDVLDDLRRMRKICGQLNFISSPADILNQWSSTRDL